jgi:hypothetical protein
MLTFARLASVVLFATTVLAGKRGLCWTYCGFHLKLQVQLPFAHRNRTVDQSLYTGSHPMLR